MIRRIFSALMILAFATTPSVSQANLPGLLHRHTTSRLDDSPVNVGRPIRVNVHGMVAFIPVPASGGTIAVTDSTGRTIRFGLPGEGPKEVKAAEPLEFDSAALLTWDPTLGRISYWTLKGDFQRSLPAMTGAKLIGTAPGGFLGAQKAGAGWRPVLFDSAGRTRELLPLTETLFDVGERPAAGKPTYAPIFGTWTGGFLVANPASYQLALYGWDGKAVGLIRRDVPGERPSGKRLDEFLRAVPGANSRSPAELRQMREMASRMELPLIAPGAYPTPDGNGRLWVMGFAGDSAYADVFSGSTFLGRIAVPCQGFQGSFDVKGAWLAVTCRPDREDFDGDAVIKLFRIRG